MLKTVSMSFLTKGLRINNTLQSRCITTSMGLFSSSQDKNTSKETKQPLKKANTPIGRLDDKWESQREAMKPVEENAYAPFPDNQNPNTGEVGGPRGPEPTRYGDWERKGRVIDF